MTRELKEDIDLADSSMMIGRYAVLDVLGQGGMGHVLKAADLEHDRHVAIKILSPESNQDQELRARFEREARAAIALDHPNIAKIYGMEVDPKTLLPFIVMEFIEGKPLDFYARGEVELPFSRLVDFIIQTARGLESASHRAIIHRDVKPANILVKADFQVKIIDFGLAKVRWDKAIAQTEGTVVGTPRYIAPEQGLGRSVDHRSDIYSLGATFYELVTHQPPFDGETATEIMLKHVHTPLVPPYMLNPKIPGDVSEIICRMLEKDPLERYQEYESLIRDLESAKIHRLAKERRLSQEELAAAGALAGLFAGSPETAGLKTGAQGSASPYLREGLVQADTSSIVPPAVAPSPLKRLALTAAGIFTLAVALTGLFSANPSRSQESSGIRSVVRRWISAVDSSAPLSPEALAAQDKERVNLTRRRMEAFVNKLVDYRRSLQGRSTTSLTVGELRHAGVCGENDSRDAWGNDFAIRQRKGGVLVAPGRDSKSDTEDDFELSLDGSASKIPPALTPEQCAEASHQ